MARTVQEYVPTRTIKTVYYYGRNIVKTNMAKHANMAVLHCVNHMQLNTYEATTAEVYDVETGVLHCVVRRTMKKIEILFKREVQNEY